MLITTIEIQSNNIVSSVITEVLDSLIDSCGSKRD